MLHRGFHTCREDALKRSEEMLESDAIKFDQFLRDNEAQVNSAIRDADMEAKKRQDRQVRPASSSDTVLKQVGIPGTHDSSCTRAVNEVLQLSRLLCGEAPYIPSQSYVHNGTIWSACPILHNLKWNVDLACLVSFASWAHNKLHRRRVSHGPQRSLHCAALSCFVQ